MYDNNTHYNISIPKELTNRLIDTYLNGTDNNNEHIIKDNIVKKDIINDNISKENSSPFGDFLNVMMPQILTLTDDIVSKQTKEQRDNNNSLMKLAGPLYDNLAIVTRPLVINHHLNKPLVAEGLSKLSPELQEQVRKGYELLFSDDRKDKDLNVDGKFSIKEEFKFLTELIDELIVLEYKSYDRKNEVYVSVCHIYFPFALQEL